VLATVRSSATKLKMVNKCYFLVLDRTCWYGSKCWIILQLIWCSDAQPVCRGTLVWECYEQQVVYDYG
jgi:hypothetical protein